MNQFVNAVNAPSATVTTNGMPALDHTGSALVSLFFKIGAARTMPTSELEVLFARALAEDKTIATKILLWARDIRGGAGERKVFRELMKFMEKNYPVQTVRMIPHISEFGRWDDLLQFETDPVMSVALQTYALALRSGDSLAAKWAPRQGVIAAKLRKVMGMSPKTYRKTVVHLTNVVEQKMCAGDWESIEFGKLPSIASKQYQKAFGRHAEVQYGAYIESLKKGDAKINAGAIFPHDVVQGMNYGVVAVAEAQWAALPNFMADVRMLPVCDVSGSMNTPVGGNTTAMEVSVALGMYISEKNPGVFNGVISTFSSKPELLQLSGSLKERYNQLRRAEWQMSTNLEAVFNLILDKATTNNVPVNEMPEYVLILSDMQFDKCANINKSAIDMIRNKYDTAGYEMPKIVFWNLNASLTNVPVAAHESGVMLVSGFSPAILKAVLAAENVDPYSVMLSAVDVDRYSLNVWA